MNTSLVQIMAWRLTGAKPLSEPCWNSVNRTLWNILQWNYPQNTIPFFQENAFQNVVWKMAAIFSWLQCVNQCNYCLCAAPGLRGQRLNNHTYVAVCQNIALRHWHICHEVFVKIVSNANCIKCVCSSFIALLIITVRCCYNAINFLQNSRKRHT